MASFVLFAATARTRIIAAYFRFYMYRLAFCNWRHTWFLVIIIFISSIIFSGSLYFGFIVMHLTHIRATWRHLRRLWWCFLNRNTCTIKEGNDVLINFK